MGLIEIERVNRRKKVRRKQPRSNTVYVEQNLKNLNNQNIEQYSFTPELPKEKTPKQSSGMVGQHIQTEGNVTNICLLTFILTAISIIALIAIGFLIFTVFNKYIAIFPKQESYTPDEFNSYLRRSFMILFGIISLLSIISMIIINRNVKDRFKYHYLSKYKVFIYDAFVVFQTTFLYICEMWVMFQVINGLYNNLLTYQTNGLITGSVNIETINVFKYIIVIIMTIFIVLNSFSSVDIIHEKNKFVFENQV